MKTPKSNINWPFRVPSRIPAQATYLLQKSRYGVGRIRDKVSELWRRRQNKRRDVS